MEKKNTGIIVLIVVLALALGLLGGYVISDKIINKDNKELQNEQNNNPNNSENNNEEYSLTAAKELMDKYIISNVGYITKLAEEDKNVISINNSKNGTIIKCKDIDNGSLKNITGDFADYKDLLYEQCKLDEEGNDAKNLYAYDEILSKKKELFGDNSTLNKESFEYGIRIYYYSTDKNGFVDSLLIPSGYDGPISEADEVISAKIINNNLEIVASNKIQNIDNPDKYDVNTYKYIFKQENNHYYLSSITEVN